MKYRILTDEELLVLEEDLKHFLIVNGIDGPEWERINTTAPDKALELVGLFSDTVLQKVYENMRYLEFRSAASCLVFKCGAESIDLISIARAADGVSDLSTAESIHKALVQHTSELTVFRTSKQYSTDRETEIHQMISSGCIPSSEEFWVSLERIV